MAGVEILAVEEVATKFAFNWTPFWIATGVIFGVFTLIGFIIMMSPLGSWKDLLFGATIGLFVGVGMGCVFGAVSKTPIEYETQYKVVLDMEVPMVEFMEKYKIVDQEGKIYTVVERGVGYDN